MHREVSNSQKCLQCTVSVIHLCIHSCRCLLLWLGWSDIPPQSSLMWLLSPSRSWETGHSGFLKHQGQASLKAGLFNIEELRLKSISINYITYPWIPLQFQRKGLSSFCYCFLPTASCVHAQSRQTFCDPMDCSLASSSVHGMDQARILEWIGISFSRGSSWPRDWTHVPVSPALAGWILYHSTTWEAIHPVYFLCLWVVQCLNISRVLLNRLGYDLIWGNFRNER